MSDYQVLARKWRPRSFQTLVGQEVTRRILTHALEQNRLHHAYLFTGTRGVGKTTIARILAKCLNCEQGITAQPCGECQSCQEIDAGRFLDLIEIDAASRTKVEDTREILDNVPYAPAKGRFKVYLIDEVHMLSGHSFNALLKTLEEPPPHVKFLLATTDPQRLPITVLSRCLQLHLSPLTSHTIGQHLQTILRAETISFEENALPLIAKAAQGSLRDALSLLEQAIAYGNGQVKQADVQAMLGNIDRSQLYGIVQALLQKKPDILFENINRLLEVVNDLDQTLAELLSLLHQVAIAQQLPESCTDTDILSLAKTITPEDVQLFYQIGLIGRRDLPFAPTPRDGFEMTLLRMLAFQPTRETVIEQDYSVSKTKAVNNSSKVPVTVQAWDALIPQLQLTGLTLALANHCILQEQTENSIRLILDKSQIALLNDKQQERLAQAITHYYQKPIHLQITPGDTNHSTPAAKQRQQKHQQQQAAEKALDEDPLLQNLLKTFDAKLIPGSIEAKSNKTTTT